MTPPLFDARNDLPTASTISTFSLRRRTPGSFVLVVCPQIGRSLKCQGQLEAAAAVVLAGCPEVKTVQEQPLKIWYSWRNTMDDLDVQILRHPPKTRFPAATARRSSYVVPDFLVELRDGSVHLIEIKPSRRIEKPVVQRKLAAARIFAQQQDWTFHVVTERHLLHGPLVRNLRLLARYRSIEADSSLLSQLEAGIPRRGKTLANLLDGVTSLIEESQVRLHLFHLLAAARLTFDPREQPLNNKTLVFPGGAVTWDPFDSVWEPNGCSTAAPSAWSASPHQIASSPRTPSSR